MDFLGRGADGVVVAAERQFDRQLAPELDDPARDRAVSLVGPFNVRQSPALVEDSLLRALEAACDRQPQTLLAALA
jgi:hypothetical protein